jgi:virginiamycin B lyase
MALWAAFPTAPCVAQVFDRFPLEGGVLYAPWTAPVPFVRGLVIGADGAAWFTEPAAGRIGRIAGDGTLTEFDVRAVALSPLGITRGPDGALWFTDWSLNRLGRIASDGSFAAYDLPPAQQNTWPAFPVGEVAGGDGNLWTSWAGWSSAAPGFIPAGIARTTPDGVSARMAVFENVWVAELLSIPGGSVWAAVRDAPPIRIDASGQVNGIDSGGASVVGFASSRGSVWFTGFDAGRRNVVGVFGASGAPKTFPLASGTEPLGVAADADGSVWYAGFGRNVLGRVTADGVLHEFAIPDASSGPSSVAVDDVGRIWFTETVSSAVGRFTPPRPSDVNGDGAVDVRDFFGLLNFLYAAGPTPAGTGDVNGDGHVDVRDAFALINALFVRS